MKIKNTIIPLLSLMLLAGCGGSTETTKVTETTTESSKPSETLKEFENIGFADVTVPYDGQAHTIQPTNVPEGTDVSYIGNSSYVDAGSYQIQVKLNKTGYKEYTASATLTIQKNDFKNVEFEDVTVTYDGLDHTGDIKVSGMFPENTTSRYTFKKDGAVVTEAIEVGDYEVTATISNPNYNDLVLNATLTIKADSEKEEFITSFGGKIYFGNPLDHSRLYTYTSSTDSLERFSYDVPRYFTEFNNGKAFLSDSYLSDSVKYLSTSNTKETVTSLFKAGNVSAMDSENNVIYYSVNSLFNSEDSGIYKAVVNFEDQLTSFTRIYKGKTKFLKVLNGRAYFSDTANGGKLSYVSISGSETQTARVLVNEKIGTLVKHGQTLLYTVKNLTGSYIAKYDVTNRVETKLTTDNGKYLTVIDDYVYYTNTDLLSTTLFGKGIYRTKLNGTMVALPGEKVLQDEEAKLSSLYYDSTSNSLYYFNVSDKHLYSYNLTSKATKDLMDGFQPVVSPVLSTGGKNVRYKNSIYYLNIHDGKTLYAYNEKTNSNTKITSDKVTDFAIIDDTLYYNEVSAFVDNNVYRVSLKAQSEPELLTENDGTDFVVKDNNLYYSLHNASQVATSINRLNLVTKEETEIYSNGVSELTFHDDTLYFLDGGDLMSMNSTQYTGNTSYKKKNLTAVHDDLAHIGSYEFVNDHIIYTYNYLLTNEIRNFDLATNTYQVIVSEDTNPGDFIVEGNDIYYYNWPKSNPSVMGIYKTTTTSSDGEQEKLLATNSTYYASSFAYLNGYLYFTNALIGGSLGDSHIYKMNLSNLNDPLVAIDII